MDAAGFDWRASCRLGKIPRRICSDIYHLLHFHAANIRASVLFNPDLLRLRGTCNGCYFLWRLAFVLRTHTVAAGQMLIEAYRGQFTLASGSSFARSTVSGLFQLLLFLVV